MFGRYMHLLGIELHISLLLVVFRQQIHKFLEILGTTLLNADSRHIGIITQHRIADAIYHCAEEVSQRQLHILGFIFRRMFCKQGIEKSRYTTHALIVEISDIGIVAQLRYNMNN